MKGKRQNLFSNNFCLDEHYARKNELLKYSAYANGGNWLFL